jgi:hypothetical protein
LVISPVGYTRSVDPSNGERDADRDAFLIVLDRMLAALDPIEAPSVVVGGRAR